MTFGGGGLGRVGPCGSVWPVTSRWPVAGRRGGVLVFHGEVDFKVGDPRTSGWDHLAAGPWHGE